MPVQNKACHERHVKKCQDNHRLRLAKMRPTIDCHAPSSMRKVASKTNAKKQQIMVSQLTLIKIEEVHAFFFCSVLRVGHSLTLDGWVGRTDDDTPFVPSDLHGKRVAVGLFIGVTKRDLTR